MTSKQLELMMMETFDKAEELIRETFEYYYNPDFTEKAGRRSIGARPIPCRYTSGPGVHCAIGRLDPTADWTEGESCRNDYNRSITIRVLRDRLCAPKGDSTDRWLLEFGVCLQQLHDDGGQLAEDNMMNIQKMLAEDRWELCNRGKI